MYTINNLHCARVNWEKKTVRTVRKWTLWKEHANWDGQQFHQDQ